MSGRNANGTVPKIGTNVPNMGTKKSATSELSALLGETRGTLLGVLYLQPEQTFHVRQLIRLVSRGQGAVQRELQRLTEAGLLLRTVQGRQVYYQANRHSALFPELQGLLLKTVGLADVLRSALAPLAAKVQVAFVYGSLARPLYSRRCGCASRKEH